ncbi:hypothetical protein KS4_27330 [Poriferisphaera corsica]|uniref:DUF393 domain-containing protein n=1 Tax=Poriferisphaera corsica TaxID=2528020 RepID=A0A517YWS4_9BACT|nr:DUF393 domain-containing protein [Poriferisphaera corsica]QDU34662.1 hypothetical protein KS4_27330 [Poriferisphaera corsica]
MALHPDITVLYDGKCPLCKREINFIKRKDKHNRITTVDIAAPNFTPAHYGRTFDQLNGRIHAFLPDGSCITGMEVFRRIYASLGLGFLVSWTRLPLARQASDRAYNWFAHNRLRLTGRLHIKPNNDNNDCDSGHCKT